MIFELAVSIQDVLEDEAQAKAQDRDLPSLEEERIEHESAALQRAEQEKQEELRKQEAATAAEEQALQQLLEDKVRQRSKARILRRKSRTGEMDSQSLASIAGTNPGAIIFDPPLMMNDERKQVLVFPAVYGKTLLQSDQNKETFTVRPLTMETRPHAPLLVLKEFSLDENGVDHLTFREQVRSSEDKLEDLKKLQHPNLVDFIGFMIHRPLSLHDNAWRVYALFEYANKGSLSELLDLVGTIAVDTLRAWMIQLLEALEFYHRSGLVHGNIHCGRVLLFRTPSGTTTVKLQASVEETLPDPIGKRRCLTASESPFWFPPELAQENAFPITKTDVWDLGIVLLQMGFGKDVLLRYTSVNALIETLGLSPPLQDTLREIFRPDPKKRPTAFQLQPSEFFRVDAPLTTFGRASNSIPRPRLDSQGGLPSSSRYNQDFDEAGRLGKGGFGEVVKARNKLDGRFYAVKKLSQNSAASLKDTLSEIMLLSRLNHPYVVRYFTAWLEDDKDVIEESAVSSTDEESSSSRTSHDTDGFNYNSAGGLDFISCSGYPKVEFGYDSEQENQETSSSENKEVFQTGSGAEAADTGSSSTRSDSSSRPVSTTLYIQMEYCEKHVSETFLPRLSILIFEAVN